MNCKKKISEELLKEAIYDAIREAAIEAGKRSYGVFEDNGEVYYDICKNPKDALAHFEFDKHFIETYLYAYRLIDDFIDCYYDNNIDDIVEKIKNKESSDVEWDI